MFTFALQPLLEHRRWLEDAARARFARRSNTHAAARETLAAIERQLRNASASPTSSACLQYLALTLESQRLAVTASGASLEEAQRTLTAASSARKAVETLRDRQRAAFEAKRRRRETRALDESNALLPSARRIF